MLIPSKQGTLLSGALVCVLALACAAQAPTAPCIAQESKSSLATSVLKPFWSQSRMEGETVLFVAGPESSQPSAHLLLQPTKILSVRSANGQIVYEQGRDFLWKAGTNVLELAPGSRIPSRTWAGMHPPLNPLNAIAEAVGGKTSLLFDRPGNIFQSLQVAVTYEHAQPWTGDRPVSARASLPRTFALLRARQPLRLVVLGDSISFGSGSSSDYRQVPCQPPYARLVADGLDQRYGSSITLQNLSVGGKTAAWGVQMAAQAASNKPDLLILAFGMNDASGRRPASDYASDIAKIIETVRAKSPSTEFLLVSTMYGNPEWSKANPTLYAEYREALRKMTGQGVALADMTTLTEEILKIKPFTDYTANGVNHPNDFGHRLYAELILSVLGW